MKKSVILLIIPILFGANYSFSQCAVDEYEVEVFIATDSYGYEGYWQLTKAGEPCGSNNIAADGNTAVGCTGGGLRTVSSGGYGNNQTFSAGTWCLKKDSLYDLHYIDDWGDGGFGFTVTVNGYDVLNVSGQGATQVWTFQAVEPSSIDGEMTEIKTPYSYNFTGANSLVGEFVNRGKDTVTSLDIQYSLDGGSTQNHSYTGISLPYGEHLEYNHNVTMNLTNGLHDLKVWCTNINLQTDSFPSNDTLLISFEVGPKVPNIIDDYFTSIPWPQEYANSSDQLNGPTDLDFHPVLSRKELWVINKRTEAIGGSTVTISNAGESNQTSVHKVDGNSWHFMSLPTGIAFGENENFGNSPGVFDANHNGGQPFTGPALWSSDPAVYAQPSGGNGSHLDMLHSSPECQGIAHEVDNVFWVFDGYNSDIVRYDFAEDHGPGADYHGDAIIHRYRDELVKKDPQDKVVSHLVLDKETNWLYVVDQGNKRVIRIDIKSGTVGQNSNINNYEAVEEYKEVVGYTWETVVDAGLTQPAGIDIIEDRMIVSDYANGEIIVYDISVIPAIEKGRISTNAIGIMGVKIGPEGNIWYVDYDSNKLFKLKQSAISLEESQEVMFEIFPNPSKGSFQLKLRQLNLGTLEIYSLTGVKVYEQNIKSTGVNVHTNLSPNVYLLKVKDQDSGFTSQKRIVIH
jgi:hypothetical protein